MFISQEIWDDHDNFSWAVPGWPLFTGKNGGIPGGLFGRIPPFSPVNKGNNFPWLIMIENLLDHDWSWLIVPMMRLLFQQPVRKDDRILSSAQLTRIDGRLTCPARTFPDPSHEMMLRFQVFSLCLLFVIYAWQTFALYMIFIERERERAWYIDRYEKYSLFVSFCIYVYYNYTYWYRWYRYIIFYNYIDISIVDLYGEIFHACRGRLRKKLWTKRVPMRLHHWWWASGRESRWVAGEENWHHTTWYRTQLVSAE